MDFKRIADLRKLIAEATPLEKWEGSGNYPFYVHIQKPAPSLSKHEGTARGENMWRYQDGAYLLSAVHELPKALDEIERLSDENKNLQEAFDQSFADYQDIGRELSKECDISDSLKTVLSLESKALDAIDWHLRELHNEKVISMSEMIRALKVISDNLKVEEVDPSPWCSGCKAMKASRCNCGPIAENE